MACNMQLLHRGATGSFGAIDESECERRAGAVAKLRPLRSLMESVRRKLNGSVMSFTWIVGSMVVDCCSALGRSDRSASGPRMVSSAGFAEMDLHRILELAQRLILRSREFCFGFSPAVVPQSAGF